MAHFQCKRFSVLCTLLLYTLLGFFAALVIVKNSIIDLLQEDLGRTARLEKVEVNPFVLSLRVLGFEVDDKDQTRFAAFDEFYVNFQLSSLFNRAWTFRDIRLVEPYFFIERFDETDSRLGRIATDFANSRPVDADARENVETENSMPRLLIHNLILSGGRVDLKDHLAVTGLTPVEEFISISKISLAGGALRYPQQSLHFSTLKVDKPRFVARLNENGSLNLADLAPTSTADPDNSPVTNDNIPWQFDVDELQLDGISVDFSDSSFQPNAKVGIRDLQYSTCRTIRKCHSRWLETWYKAVVSICRGKVRLLPDVSVSAKLSTRDLPLAIGQPYVQLYANIEINNGVLNSDIDMSFAVDQNLTASGSIAIPG